MVGVTISAILVGFPAAIGAFLVLAPKGERNLTAGAGVIAFALILAVVFALALPEGKLVPTQYWLKMPGVFAGGLVLGGAVALIKRLFAK